MNLNKRIYLDYNATTPIWPSYGEKLQGFVKIQDSPWGNPSSIHWASREAKVILRETRQMIADQLRCSPLEIIFNSGGSEGNNTVLKTFLFQFLKNPQRKRILISSVEHPSVLKTAEFLSSFGMIIEKIPVSREGNLDESFIQKTLQAYGNEVALVSVMAANNETGVIHNIKKIASWAHAVGAYMHSDMVQMLGKEPVNLKELDVDYASFSLHKIYCAKGSGFLFVKKNSPFENLIHGGGQERHRRGGTENLFSLSCAHNILPHYSEILQSTQNLKSLRDHFEKQIQERVSGVTITASAQSRLANTSHLTIEGVDGEVLLLSLDLEGFAVSTGAACSSGSPEPSPVLLNMGFAPAEAQKSLRVSLGALTKEEEVEKFIETLVQTVERLRRVTSEYAEKQNVEIGF